MLQAPCHARTSATPSRRDGVATRPRKRRSLPPAQCVDELHALEDDPCSPSSGSSACTRMPKGGLQRSSNSPNVAATAGVHTFTEDTR